MQVNTKGTLTHYSMAACTIANHIFKLIQEHDIKHEYNKAEGSITVDIPADHDFVLNLKVIISLINAEELAKSNFDNPPYQYIKYIDDIKHSIWHYLDTLRNEPGTLYLELDFIDVETAKKHVQR